MAIFDLILPGRARNLEFVDFYSERCHRVELTSEGLDQPAHSEKVFQLQKLTWSLIKINFESAERLYNACHFLGPI